MAGKAYNDSRFAGRQVAMCPNLIDLDATAASHGGIAFGRRVQITRIGFAVKTALAASLGTPTVSVKQGSTVVATMVLTTTSAAFSAQQAAITRSADTVVESDETLTFLVATAGTATNAGDGHLYVEYEELYDVAD